MKRTFIEWLRYYNCKINYVPIYGELIKKNDELYFTFKRLEL